MKIIGSGALNIDYFYRVSRLEDLPFTKGLKPGGEVWGTRDEFDRLRQELQKRGELLAVCGGGSAANTIFALKNWGFETGFIGLVGEDEEGDRALEELAGADLSRVIRSGKTAACLIILDDRKDRALFVAPHSQEKLLAQLEVETESKEWLHLSSLVTEEGFGFHLRLVQKHPGELSLDPGEIYARRGFPALRLLFEKGKILFLTSQELALLGVSPEEFPKTISYLVLKEGKKGARIYDGQGETLIPPEQPVALVDNTGAGDVFDAGFLAGVFSGLSPSKAGRLAAKLAALSLRHYGRLGFPSREEFQNLYQEVLYDSQRS